MQKYNIISLGYVCNVFGYLNSDKTLHKNLKSSVFDRIASPMWAINELVSNDFEDFLKDDNIKHDQLFDKSDRKEHYDSRYYVRFLKTAKLDDIREIFNRKIEKLNQILNSDEPVLFVRCEEKHQLTKRGSRIIFDEYKDKYSKNELAYVKLFSNTLKNKYPSLNFKILFMGQSGDNFVDKEHGIVGIGYPESEFCSRDGPRSVGRLLKENRNFIDRNL